MESGTVTASAGAGARQVAGDWGQRRGAEERTGARAAVGAWDGLRRKAAGWTNAATVDKQDPKRARRRAVGKVTVGVMSC